MNRIAVVFNGDLSKNRQGQLNSAICRIKHLQQQCVFDVEAYCIQEYSVGLLRLIRKEKMPQKKDSALIDGIKVNIIYKKSFFIDVFLETRLKVMPLLRALSYKIIARRFRSFDLISGHSIIGGELALSVKKQYGIPYSVTWHGSDIHTLPVHNTQTKKLVSHILNGASGNIFVSQSLYLTCIELFGGCPNPQVIYNAADSSFYKFPDAQRNTTREKWGVYQNKVVAYVGNLEAVKNVEQLPIVFQTIQRKQRDVCFWIIGDGAFRRKLEQEMKAKNISCVFWGNQQPESMPEYMNCIDVLILPSKNESFGMVLVEAIACGANAVGSNRGGIPEVIGEVNCFELDESFADKISDRIVYMLRNKVEQSVNPEFNWSRTAEKEARLFKEIINR